MFDIGFSEVVVIFVLALVVLGPEKLPKVAAQVGRWIGRARGMARQFREQLEEEVNLEETRKAQASAPRAPVTPAAQPWEPATPNVAAPANGAADAPANASGTPAPGSSGDTSHAPHEPAHSAAPVSSPSASYGPSDPPEASASSPPAYVPSPEPEQQAVYPDHYSHAHPTDSMGRPIEAPTNEPPAVEAGQQDWVGGVTPTEKPNQPTAAYAAPNERGP
jgi:sec-independent protein translocase protein TatB